MINNAPVSVLRIPTVGTVQFAPIMRRIPLMNLTEVCVVRRQWPHRMRPAVPRRMNCQTQMLAIVKANC